MMFSVKERLLLIALVLCLIGTIALSGFSLPRAGDWDSVYLPASEAFASGRSVFVTGFFNPPWLLPILYPIAALPYMIGRLVVLLLAISSFMFVAWRFGAKPLGIVAFALSPLVCNSLGWGNVEWVVALGIALGGPVGLLLVFIKPQMGTAIVLFWLVEAWRKNGWRGIVKLAILPVVVCLVSFALFGFWIPNMLSYTDFCHSIVDLFPYSIPIGIALVITSLRTRKVAFAVAASPFFSPVTTPQVWMVVPLALSSLAWQSVALLIIQWAILVWAPLVWAQS